MKKTGQQKSKRHFYIFTIALLVLLGFSTNAFAQKWVAHQKLEKPNALHTAYYLGMRVASNKLGYAFITAGGHSVNGNAVLIFKKDKNCQYKYKQTISAPFNTRSDEIGYPAVSNDSILFLAYKSVFIPDTAAPQVLVYKLNKSGLWVKNQDLKFSSFNDSSRFNRDINISCSQKNLMVGRGNDVLFVRKDSSGLWQFRSRLIPRDSNTYNFGAQSLVSDSQIFISGGRLINGKYHSKVFYYRLDSNTQWKYRQSIDLLSSIAPTSFGVRFALVSNKLIVQSLPTPNDNGGIKTYSLSMNDTWSLDTSIADNRFDASYIDMGHNNNEFSTLSVGPGFKQNNRIAYVITYKIDSSGTVNQIDSFYNRRFREDLTMTNESILVGARWDSSSYNNGAFANGSVYVRNRCIDTYDTLKGTFCNLYTGESGKKYIQTGVYIDTFLTDCNCTVYKTLDLTVNKANSSYRFESACDSFNFFDSTLTQSGVYNKVLTNYLGCDSTVWVDLTIIQSKDTSLNLEACDSIKINNETLDSTGIYQQIVRSNDGCDSVLSINLTLWESDYHTSDSTVCEGIRLNSKYYGTSGVYETFRYKNIHNCDSVGLLNVTVNKNASDSISVTACDSARLIDKTYYTSTNTILQTFTRKGCDSSIYLDLTIYESNDTLLNINSCGPYKYNGNEYTEDGLYENLFKNKYGCDSIVELNIKNINPNTGILRVGAMLTANETTAKYQWLDCENNNFNPISGENSRKFTPKVNGQYAVEIMKNSCTDTSNCIDIFNVGIEKRSEDKVSILFDPFLEEVRFESNQEIMQVWVYDARGKLVFNQELRTKQGKININNPSGLYLIKLQLKEDQIITKPLILF